MWDANRAKKNLTGRRGFLLGKKMGIWGDENQTRRAYGVMRIRKINGLLKGGEREIQTV